MGISASNLAKEKQELEAQPVVEGHWVSDLKTGYRWATDPIISDSSVQKRPLRVSLPGLPGEEWGPYPKKFTKSVLGGKVFTPPETVDGVPLLTQCRKIPEYVRSSEGGRIFNAEWALATGKAPPACWEDTTSFKSPYGGTTFTVRTRDPSFYTFMASQYGPLGVAAAFLGGKTRKKKRRHKQTRKRAV